MTHHKHSGKRSRNVGQKWLFRRNMTRCIIYNPDGSKKLAINFRYDVYPRRVWFDTGPVEN